MSDTTQQVNIGRLIFWPSVITLGITVLRLVGELQHWPKPLFNPDPGGGGALIGISWLPLIFGVYFAIKLAGAGEGPASTGRAILIPVLGILVIIAGFVVSYFAVSQTPTVAALLVNNVVALIGLAIQYKAWPALFKTLLAYAFAARIPVAVVMLLAIYGNWGTHYDVSPTPEFPAMHWFSKWLVIGAIPQLAIWIAITVIIGGLVGGIAAAITRRKTSTQQPAPA